MFLVPSSPGELTVDWLRSVFGDGVSGAQTERIGEAYQVADDLCDAVGNPHDAGKPIGQDVAHGRPSATRELGVPGAIKRLEQLVTEGVESIPSVATSVALTGDPSGHHESPAGTRRRRSVAS